MMRQFFKPFLSWFDQIFIVTFVTVLGPQFGWWSLVAVVPVALVSRMVEVRFGRVERVKP
jgi:hypothetical protein